MKQSELVAAVVPGEAESAPVGVLADLIERSAAAGLGFDAALTKARRLVSQRLGGGRG